MQKGGAMLEQEVKKMKKIVIIVIILMISGVSYGKEGRSSEADNGIGWKQNTEAMKVSWVAGFMAGDNVACEKFGGWTSDETTDWNDESLLRSIGVSKEYVQRCKTDYKRLSIIGITVGQLQDGMDKFYEDYRNQRITMVDAIYVVKMEIEGERQELIEAQKRYLRTGPGSSSERLAEIVKYVSQMETGEIKNIKEYQELRLKCGQFAEPKVEKPTKMEDYDYTELFCYGTYE